MYRMEEVNEVVEEQVEETTEEQTEEVESPELDTEENTTEEVESEELDEDTRRFLDDLQSKVKYMDEEVKINNIDELVEGYQKGLDYTRQLEKKTALENQLKSFDTIAKTLYPDNVKSGEELLQAMVNNEITYIENEAKEKYPDAWEKVLKGDERYNNLKNIEPIKINTDEEIASFEKDVKSINGLYGEAYESYQDLPVEIREYAGKHGISLMEAYKVKNFDAILDKKLQSSKKSMMADISEGRKKTMPKKSESKKASKQYFTMDEIKSMSSKEAAKPENYDKIIKSYAYWRKQ